MNGFIGRGAVFAPLFLFTEVSRQCKKYRAGTLFATSDKVMEYIIPGREHRASPIYYFVFVNPGLKSGASKQSRKNRN